MSEDSFRYRERERFSWLNGCTQGWPGAEKVLRVSLFQNGYIEFPFLHNLM